MNNLALFSEMLFKYFHPIFTEKKNFLIVNLPNKVEKYRHAKIYSFKIHFIHQSEKKSIFLSEWSIIHTVDVKFVLIAY